MPPFRLQQRLRKLRKRMRKRMQPRVRLFQSLGLWAIPAERRLRAAERGASGEVAVWIGPGRRFVLRAGTTDTNVFRQHFVARELYGIPQIGAVRVIVDLGAHIGLATEVFRRNYPDARIVSVEMDPQNFALCVRNHHDTVSQDSIQAAVWSSTGMVQIDDVGEGNWAYRVRGVGSADVGPSNRGRAVPAVAFSDLVFEQGLERISILKVDIEGSEAELFESAWKQIFSVTDLVVMEIHDWIPGVRERVDAALERARQEFELEISQTGQFTCIKTSVRRASAPVGLQAVGSA